MDLMPWIMIGALVAWALFMNARINAISMDLEQHRRALHLLQEAINYRTQQLAAAINDGRWGQSPDGTDGGTSGAGRSENTKH